MSSAAMLDRGVDAPPSSTAGEIRRAVLGQVAVAGIAWATIQRSDSPREVRAALRVLYEAAQVVANRAVDLVPEHAPASVWHLIDEPFARSAAMLTLMEMPTRRWLCGASAEPLLRVDAGLRLVATDYCQYVARFS